MSCSIGCRCSWDSVLLCLWHRVAAATPTQLLAWELPYAAGAAVKKKKKKKKKQTNTHTHKKKKQKKPTELTNMPHFLILLSSFLAFHLLHPQPSLLSSIKQVIVCITERLLALCPMLCGRGWQTTFYGPNLMCH